tara:strand:- start:2483 stop:2758 length:276 start_codon:yes stop_codon:yes gene_type:complete
MTLAWYDWIGSLGVFLILFTYFLLQTDRIHAQAIPYSVMNLLGASFIAVSLLYDFNFSAFVIEICWIAISIVGIVRTLRRRRMELNGARDQ